VTWDYIIVGAGSAGCALASELAKNGKDKTVLILEAGGTDRSPFIKFPAGQIRAVGKYDWGYRSQPDPSRNGVAEGWLRGRVLGGSSSINGMLYARGESADYDRWDAICGHAGGWSAQDVLPLFREMERSDQAGPLRGRAGPLSVRTVKSPHPLTTAFVGAACSSGYSLNDDYNGKVQEGVAYAQLSQRGGLRCSAADAFLKPILSRSNVKLLLNARVEKIKVTHGHADAVCYSSNGRPCREEAREIILCAGAIASPQLLMLSGVGDPEELHRHNIAVAVDLKGVGRNLSEHPLLRLTYRTNIPTYNLTQGPLQKLAILAKFVATREGPIANLFESVAFLKSSPSEQQTDIQLHFLALGYLARPDGMIELARFPSVTVLANKSHPKSRGRIRLASANPTESPLIECRLLEDDADVDTLVQGIQTVRKIMKAEPIAALISEEVAPGSNIQSVAALQEYIRGHTTIAAHPAGTCRMGADAGAVVDANLRVHGIENLWVADASIMPDLIGGNTNAACMMIGMKLGKWLNSSGGKYAARRAI
jgi:choline dehydrogenase